MKKSLIATAALAACVLLPANAWAQNQASVPMDIRARVVAEACTISASSLVDFGAVTDSKSTSTQQTFDVSVSCSSDQSVLIGIDAGQNFEAAAGTRHVVGAGASRIAYLLIQPDGQTEWGDQGLLNPTHPAPALSAVISANISSSFVGGAVLQPTAGLALNSGDHTDTVNVIVEF